MTASSAQSSLVDLPKRPLILGLSLLGGALFILILSVALSPESGLATLLLDRLSPIFPYPFTIQNVMYMAFFFGMGDLITRWQTAQWEAAFMSRRLLPEDEQTVLQASDLGPIRRQVAGRYDVENGFLPSLIDLCILQFQASRSVDQTVAVLNSSLELIAHRVDLRYSWIRYAVWVIPTLGFIGTVVGIADALAVVGQGSSQEPDLGAIAARLAIAFNTTIVALVLSALLVLLLHYVQMIEERSVNLSGGYCLRNLINRLYTAGH